MPKNVHPANRTEKIRVTADIIERSKTANSSHCMVAEAIRACVPGANGVSIDLQTIRFKQDNWLYVGLTPRPVQQVILDFDDGKAPDPFQFTFRPIQVIERHPRKRGTPKPKPTPSKLVRRIAGQKTVGKKIAAGNSIVQIGGDELPKMKVRPSLPADPKRPRAGTRREFGVRAFRTGHNL